MSNMSRDVGFDSGLRVKVLGLVFRGVSFGFGIKKHMSQRVLV